MNKNKSRFSKRAIKRGRKGLTIQECPRKTLNIKYRKNQARIQYEKVKSKRGGFIIQTQKNKDINNKRKNLAYYKVLYI